MSNPSSRNIRVNTSARLPQSSRLHFDQSDSPGPGGYLIREPLANGVKFPLAKRRPLFDSEETPAPGSYSIVSCFDNKKSYSFSPKLSKSVPKYPGPGAYQVKEVVVNAARPVIGKEKRKDNFFNEELAALPGPGRYNFRVTLAEGPRWKFGSETSRKKQDIVDTPGPGSYEIPDTKSKVVFKFPSGRKNEKYSAAPGPGYYNVQGNLRYSLFTLSRSEKFQKISGPLLPGPGDYNVSNTSFRVMGSTKSIVFSDAGK
jgi:hypothetical protein